MRKKRVWSLLLAIVLTLSMFDLSALSVFADAGDNKGDPLTNVNDTVNFPVYGDEGAVRVLKDAQWVADDAGGNVYARVDTNIKGVPKASGVDVVMILDNSASMGVGQTTEYGQCLNPSHWETMTFTKAVSYYAHVDPTLSALKAVVVTDTLTMTAKVHFEDDNTSYNIFSVSVDPSGFSTSHNGKPILAYGTATTKATTFIPADLANPENIRLMPNVQKWLIGTTKLIGFGGETKTQNGRTVTIPTSVDQNYMLFRSKAGENYISSSCYTRSDVAHNAGNAFVDTFFEKVNYSEPGKPAYPVDSNNKLGIVSFNSDAVSLNGGEFYTSSDADQLAAKADLSSITPAGYTSYVNALSAAKTMLDNREDQDRPAYIVFMSDGEPYYTNTQMETLAQTGDAVGALQPLVGNIFAVGVGLATEEAKDRIRQIGDGNASFVTDDNINDLIDLFKQIARQTAAAGTNAVITDNVIDPFELVPDSTKYPWTVTIGGVEQANPALSSSGNTLTWNLGNIPMDATLSYYIRIKDGTPEGVSYPVSDDATILYQNYLEKWCEKEFNHPELPYPGGSINVVYYAVDANGQPISANGTPLADDSRLNIMSQGYILKQEFIQENGKPILTPGNTYTREELDYTANGFDFERQSMRIVDRFNNEEDVTGDAWKITLADLQSSYTVLVGYSADLTLKVINTYGNLPPEETSEALTVAEAFTKAPTDRAGYEIDEVEIVATNLLGQTISTSGFTIDPTTKQVTGKMPLGNVEINFIYKGRGDIDYTYEYYVGDMNDTPETWTQQGTLNAVIDVTTLDTVLNKYKPNEWYMDGEVQPGSATTISADPAQNIVKILYKGRDDVPYTYEYYQDDMTNQIAVDPKTGLLGETIEVTSDSVLNAHIPNEYYNTGVVQVGSATTISDDPTKNIVKILYTTEGKPIPYTYEYYAPDMVTKIKTVTEYGYRGDPIDTTSLTVLNAHKPNEWYKDGEVQAGSATVISSDLTKNIVKILYISRPDVPYTYEYYAPDMTTKIETVTEYGTIGDTIDTTSLTVLNAEKPNEWYLDGVVQAGSATVISDDITKNVVKILYAGGPDVPYTYEYYQDDMTNQIAVDPKTGQMGTAIDLTSDSVLNAHKPNASYGDGVVQQADSATIISDDPTKNIVKILYLQEDDIKYTYEYYVGDMNNRTAVEPRTGALNADIDVSIDVLNLHKPNEWYLDGVVQPGSAEKISRDPAQNIVKILYTSRPDVPYTYEYYAPDMTTKIETVTKYGTIGDTIDTTSNTVLNDQKPNEWYEDGVLQAGSATVISDDITKNIVKILYTSRPDVPYTYEYYVGDMNSVPIVEAGAGMIGDVIDTTSSTILDAHRPTNYQPGKLVPGSATVISDTPANNVVQILYDAPLKYDYKIIYYKDVLSRNRVWDTVYSTEPLPLGTTIPVDNNYNRPTGYWGDGTVTGATVITDGDNTVHVVYEKMTGVEYTILYYYDEVIPGAHFDKKVSYGDYGDAIIPDLTGKGRDGDVIPATKVSGPSTIGEVEADNVVVVLYSKTKDLGYEVHYYKDGIINDGQHHIDTIKGTGTFGQVIPLELYHKVPTGYIGPGTPYGPLKISYTGNVVYVVYTTKQSYLYQIKYYQDEIDVNDDNLITTLEEYARFGDPIVANPYLFAPDGYVVPGKQSGADKVSEIAANNIRYVLYDEKEILPYTVTYYKDFIHKDLEIPNTKVSGTLPYGTLIPVDEAGNLPEGYVLPAEVVGPQYIRAQNNNVTVLYNHKADYKYMVEYHTDTYDGPKVGEVPGYGKNNQVIDYSTIDLSLFKVDGYKTQGRIDPHSITRISVNEALNIVYVVLDPSDDIPYTYEYYVGNMSNRIAVEPRTGTLNTDIDVTSIGVLNMHKPNEWYKDGEVQAGSATKISSDPTKNIVKILYTSRPDVPYTYEYYAPDMTTKIETVTEYGTIGDIIDTTSLTVLNAEKPNEWYLDGVLQAGSATVISDDITKNVVKILYAGGPDVPYTYEYYQDNLSNQIAVDPKTGQMGATIDVTSDSVLNAHKPNVWYEDGAVQAGSATVISDDITKNVVKILYTSSPDVPYTYEYYAPDMTTKIETVTKYGSIGDTIDTTSLTVLNDQKPNEWYLDGVVQAGSATVISDDITKNVVKILYVGGPNVPYTYEYYQDDMTNQIAVDPKTGQMGAAIDVTLDVLNAHKPNASYGDGVVQADSATIISDDPTKNIVKILYIQETNIDYTYEYYVGDMSNQTAVEPMTGTLNDDIDVTIGVLNMHKPNEWYLDGEVQPGSAEKISRDPAQNIVKILYRSRTDVPYTYEYYAPDMNTKIETVTEYGTIGDTIDTTSLTVLNAQKPNEWYEDGVLQAGSATVISDDITKNVVKILYAGGPKVPYTYEYYFGDTNGTPILEPRTGTLNDIIDTTSASVLNLHQTDGPADEYFEGVVQPGSATRISDDPTKNIVKIVYDEVLYYEVRYMFETVDGGEEEFASEVMEVKTRKDQEIVLTPDELDLARELIEESEEAEFEIGVQRDGPHTMTGNGDVIVVYYARNINLIVTLYQREFIGSAYVAIETFKEHKPMGSEINYESYARTIYGWQVVEPIPDTIIIDDASQTYTMNIYYDPAPKRRIATLPEEPVIGEEPIVEPEVSETEPESSTEESEASQPEESQAGTETSSVPEESQADVETVAPQPEESQAGTEMSSQAEESQAEESGASTEIPGTLE